MDAAEAPRGSSADGLAPPADPTSSGESGTSRQSASPADSGDSASSGETWTVLRMMGWSGEYLQGKGIERGRLDAEYLLADLLGCGRLELYLQYDRPLTPAELAGFKKRLLRRAAREPLQYILGRTPFRDLDLLTDPRVLIPRPETEQLVDAVLEWARGRSDLSALDVGTGSGAIALSLAMEGPFGSVVATDLSAEALEVARGNLDAHADGIPVPVAFRMGAGYEPLREGERFDLIVSNPPYIAEGEADALAPEIRDWEPEGALMAGPEGLDVLAVLVAGAAAHLEPDGLLALEIGEEQAARVGKLIEETGAFAQVRVVRDLAGKDRIVLAELRSP